MRTARLTRRAAASAMLALPAAARAEGSLGRVRDLGRLRLGLHVEDTRMAFLNPAGQPDGLAVALAEALAAGMGLRTDFHATLQGDQVADLHTGRFDLLLTAPAMTVEAARVMMFSAPYAGVEWELLAPRAMPPGGAEALAEGPVAQVTGWNGVFAQRLLGQPPRRALLLPDWRAIARALSQGEAAAAAVPATMAERITAALPAIGRKLLLGQAWMGLAARHGEHDLLEAVNAQLHLLRQRGALAILHRHFLGTALPAQAGLP